MIVILTFVRSLSFLVLPDHLEKLLPVARQLGVADAVDVGHLGEIRRAAARHVDQALVGQHHVGGQVIGLAAESVGQPPGAIGFSERAC